MTHDMETVERAALEDLHAAAPADVRTALGVDGAVVGPAFVSLAAGLPPSAVVINRAIGLGSAGDVDRDTIDEIVGRYQAAEIARYFVHLNPDTSPPKIGDWLVEHGLEKARGWAKFERGREAAPTPRTDMDIRPATPDDADAFGRIVSDAFDLGASAASWIGALIGRPGWHIYMSFDGDTPAGCGTLFVKDDLGWLDWGATAPAFRGRGGQSAILARRVQAALDLGCRALGTETGEEVPGDPQHSYNNIRRAGFVETHVRANYAPPKSS
jgi:GNAT superfamily N-acetyltransferase